MTTYAIGDVHGCIDHLKAALQWIDADDKMQATYFLGDYVDRGTNNRDVINLVRNMSTSDDRYKPIRGNHDIMMADAVLDRHDTYMWLNNGGDITLKEYTFGIEDDEAEKDARWLRSLPDWLEDDYRIYVHAGFLPHKGWRGDPSDITSWVRREFLDYHNFDYDGKLVVHGHTPCIEPDIKKNRLGIDTGAVFGKHYSEQYGWLTVARWDDKNQLSLVGFSAAGRSKAWELVDKIDPAWERYKIDKKTA